MADFEFTLDEFTALAAKLDAIGTALTPTERAILLAVFQMAGDSVAGQGGGEEGLPSPSTGGDLETRLASLEERVRALEGEGGFESVRSSLNLGPTVRLQTDSFELPRLSDGFLGSFQPGSAKRLHAADDVSVGVSVGVMF